MKPIIQTLIFFLGGFLVIYTSQIVRKKMYIHYSYRYKYPDITLQEFWKAFQNLDPIE